MPNVKPINMHCDSNANHRFSSIDHTAGAWCPKCGEGAALRMDAAEPEQTDSGDLLGDGEHLAYVIGAVGVRVEYALAALAADNAKVAEAHLRRAQVVMTF
jgi:hypothetical protein